jgi:hypothetical protein
MARLLVHLLAPMIAALACAMPLAARSPQPQDATQPPPLSEQDLRSALNAGPQGTLAIRAIQGTKGAPEVGVAEIAVILFHRNQPVWQMTSSLDDHGVAVINTIPVVMAVRPVVRVKYGGVLYQDSAPEMDPDHREASVNVTVYQTTDEAPVWHVAMRHLVATRADNMINVSETVVVENPSDKTWLGAPPDARDRRATVVLALPENTTDVQLETGFFGWSDTAFAARNLIVQMPLMPGKTTYRYSYRVPVTGGTVRICIAAPGAPIDHAMFMIPDDATTAEPILATPSGAEAVGQARVRVFSASAVPPGQDAGIVLSGLVTIQDLASASNSNADIKKIAGIVAAALLLVGLGVVFIRSKKRARLGS